MPPAAWALKLHPSPHLEFLRAAESLGPFSIGRMVPRSSEPVKAHGDNTALLEPSSDAIATKCDLVCHTRPVALQKVTGEPVCASFPCNELRVTLQRTLMDFLPVLLQTISTVSST